MQRSTTELFPDGRNVDLVGYMPVKTSTCNKLVETRNVGEDCFCCTDVIKKAVANEHCAALEELTRCPNTTAIINSFQNKLVLAFANQGIRVIGHPWSRVPVRVVFGAGQHGWVRYQYSVPSIRLRSQKVSESLSVLMWNVQNFRCENFTYRLTLSLIISTTF